MDSLNKYFKGLLQLIRMIDAYTLSIIIFITVVAIIVYRDRKNIERQFILVLRKTKRGRSLLIKISRSHPLFWKYIGNIGVVFGFAGSVYIVYSLIIAAIRKAASLALVLPSFSSETVVMPGLIAPPFWDWVISIALLVVVHEGSHGIMAAVEKVKIKSLGWGFLAIIPIAFVEPDEKQLARKPTLSQLRVFAAGSFANIITAFIFSLIISLFTSAFFANAVFITTPMEKGNETVNQTVIIVKINNYTINNSTTLKNVLETVGPNRTINVLIKTIENDSLVYKDFTLKTVDSADKINIKEGYIGVKLNQTIVDYPVVKDSYLRYESPLLFFRNLFFFIFLINLGVGLANLLPIKPLDGGRMWDLLFKKITPKHSKNAINILSFLTIFVVILNFIISLHLFP